jgi:tetratricopeptide (TPR) repeat protein
MSWPALAVAAILCGLVTFSAGYLARPRPQGTAGPAKAEEGLQQKLEEANKKLEEANKKLEDQRVAMVKELRRVPFYEKMMEGHAAMAAKKYEEAKQAYRQALDLFPDDPKATAALTDAKTSLEAASSVASRDKEDRDKRQGEVQRLLKEAAQAKEKKQYAAAVRILEDVRQLAPADMEVAKALTEAQAALDADTTEKKKLEAYKQHMTAGKAALDAQRFADAVREYTAAQELFPGDPDSAQGQKTAENSIAAIEDLEKRKAAHKELFERGTASLKDKKYDDAVASFSTALKYLPADKETEKVLNAARSARAEAKQQFTALMEQGDVAMTAKRYEQARRLYEQANDVWPDPAAQRGMAAATKALNDLITAQDAYNRFIGQASVAMDMRRFADALRFYQEALRVAPGDLTARQGIRDAQAALGENVKAAKGFEAAMQAGNQAVKLRHYSDAVSAFEEALRIAPGNADARQGLRYSKAMAAGQKALIARKAQEAIDAFQSALKEVPDDQAATVGLQQAKLLKR